MVLATVLVDPPFAAGIGALFALIAAPSIALAVARGTVAAEVRRHALWGGALGGWFGLAFIYHCFTFPAWMMSYAADPRSLPTAVWYPLFLAFLIACGALSGFVSARLIATGRKSTARALTAGLFILYAGLFLLGLERYLVLGTYDDFWAGRALPLQQQAQVLKSFNVAAAVAALFPVALLSGRLLQLRALRTEAARG